jgi:hypothetical protein
MAAPISAGQAKRTFEIVVPICRSDFDTARRKAFSINVRTYTSLTL